MIRYSDHPRLPTELTDLIIDHLAHNLHDELVPRRRYRPHVLAPLLACSSVSKAFHQRTSHHIFSTIILTESALSGNKRHGRKQTISGLLDILENNDELRRRVHTLKLYTAPIRLPAKYAWGDVDEDFPTILKDIFLPRVLHKLTWTRSLHLLHRNPESFRYSDLSEDMKLGIEAILHGECLSRLELVGFSEIPDSFLHRCLHLTELDYHECAWRRCDRAQIFAPVPKGIDNVQDSKLTCHSLPVNLRYACFTGCNDLVEALIAGGAFSGLKTFKHNLSDISDIYASSRIVHQASSTLETLHINDLNAQHFMEDHPIDFGLSSSLREITISTFGSVQSPLLHALCKLLTTRSAPLLFPISINSPIEIVRLEMRWGSARFRSASLLFEHHDPGWEELDRLLSSSPIFRRLRVVEIRVGMTIDEREDSSDRKDVCQLREEVFQSMKKLFRTLRATRAVKLSILIDYPILV